MKTEEQQKARELRRKGWSVKAIERELGVSRSSVSRWVRDIELSEEQRRRLMARTPENMVRAAAGRVRAARMRRAGHQMDGRRRAREPDADYAAGCMLYWAEGSKTRNSAQLSNSDPDLVLFFVQFLRQHFGVPNGRFRVYCNLFADHLERQQEIENFWLNLLRLPPSCLCKSIVNTYSKYSQKKRTNKLPYGTCRVAVHSTRIAQTIYGSIQEYGGFERPAWLD